MPKYIFFDLDNTLTRSRSPITKEMSVLLKKLSVQHEVLVVSGATTKQIGIQLGEGMSGKYWVMGQNGNMCVNKSGEVLWENKMDWMQKLEVLSYASMIISKRLFKWKDKLDLVQDRGCQISYSIIGHSENIDKKERCDPKQEKRLSVLRRFPFKSKTVEVKIGGTTCLDFFVKGYNKGRNVEELYRKMKWKKSDCLYIGDALFKNGNDETVIGIVPTQAVENPKATERVIAEILSGKR